MGWLLILMAAVAAVIYAVLPFWVSFGFSVAIAWCGWLLYLIFYRPDSLSQELRVHVPPNSSRR